MSDQPEETFGKWNLISPIDEITAKGLESWADSPPLYHNLDVIPYVSYDVKEWMGKLQKFKAETVSYAARCQNLEAEVEKLKSKLSEEAAKTVELDEQLGTFQEQTEELTAQLKLKLNEHGLAVSDCGKLRKARAQLQKQCQQMETEICETNERVELLRKETEFDRLKHLAALGEKEKLSLEREWFLKERRLLEETTKSELQNIEILKTKLAKLRFCLQKAWADTKEIDLLGHLRATRKMAYTPEWYAARKKISSDIKKDSNENAGELD